MRRQISNRRHAALRPRAGLALVLAASLTCSKPGAPGGGGRADGQSVGSSAAALNVNPARGTDGKGPLQALGTHVFQNFPGTGDDAYLSSGTNEATSGVDNGIYNYTMPIRVPDGPAGLKPKLAFSYSSARGNGPLGVGWTLAGASVISRCGHNMGRDGFSAGFDFNTDFSKALNQYCIDGVKLVPTHRLDNVVEFQAEGADFAKIEAFYDFSQPGDPDYFRVLGKDGLVYLYGYNYGQSASSKSRADGQLGGATTNPDGGHWTYGWYLALVTDLNANSIVYKYLADFGSPYSVTNTPQSWGLIFGQTRYISEIDYGTTSIQLHWNEDGHTPRPDLIENYAFGFDLAVGQRLTDIQIITNGGDPNGLVWRYFPDYAQSVFTGRSEIVAIHMADRFKKERATYFNWNTYDRPLDQSRLGDGSDFTITSYPMGGNCATDPAHCLPQNATRVVLTDLNGDGMDDVLYSLADPSTANAVRLKVRMGGVNGLGDETDAGVAFNAGEAAGLDGAATGDFDGDGRSEIIWDRLNWTSTPPSGSFPGYYPSGQPATHVVSRWNGTALETIPSSSALSWIVSTHWAPYWDHTALMDPRAVRIADFNGDGILDLLGGSTDSNDRSAPQEIWLGMNHNSFNAFAGPLTGPRPGVNVSQILGYTKPLFFGDVDGDGRADILTTPVADRRGIFFTDLNGDGLVEELDFAAMESHVECSNKNVSVKVEANTGRIPTWLNPSFPTPYTAALQVPSGVGACSMLTPSELHLDYAQSVRSGDFNGDGLQDILLLNVGVDGGTTVYARGIGLQATKPADCGHCPDGSVVQCWEQATHREKGKAHSIHPVLLLATGDTTQPFVSTVLPLQGARFREETFSTTPDFFEGGTCFSGPHLVVPGSSNWESHFWNGTAVGDINGDGLADVVQMVLDGGAMKLETITAKKQELGLTHRKDVIVQVLDGLKSRTGSGPALAEQIQYGDLAAMATLGSYTVPSTCAMSSSPTGAGCLLKGTVVSTFSPLGRQATRINYRYEAARVDPKGRGVFGFDKIVENDTGFGVRKTTTKTFKRAVSALDDSFGTTTYAAASLAPVADAHFPRFVSWNDALPPPISPHMYWTQQQTVETVHSDLVFTGGFSTPAPLQRVVTTTTNELVSSPMPFRPAANSFYVRPLKIDVSDSYIAAATSAGQTQAADLHRTIDYVYDDYSNPKQVTTTVDGGTSERVVTQYNNDTANWFIGQPKHIEHYAYPGATFDPSNVRTTDYLYWNDGRLQTETVEPTADPTADLNKVTNYTYHTGGTIQTVAVTGIDSSISTTVPQTRTTTYTWDAANIHPVQITNALNQATSLTWAAGLDVPMSIVDPNGVGVDYIYDGFGVRIGTFPDATPATVTTARMSSSGDPSNASYQRSTWTASFPATNGTCLGAILSVGNQCFVETQQDLIDFNDRPIMHSKRGFETKVQNGPWWDKTFAYDTRARLSQEINWQARGGATPQAITTHEYDGLDRRTKIDNANGTARQWAYPSRLKTQIFDELSHQVTQTLDNNERLAITAETVSNTTGTGTHVVTTTFGYDPFGNRTTIDIKDGSGTVRETTIGYDLLGRHINTVDPGSGTLVYKYNPFGDLRFAQDAAQSARNIQNDGLGRPVKSQDVFASTKYETYTWDTAMGSGVGKLAQTTSMPDNVVQEYRYTNLGQLNLRATNAVGKRYQVLFQYDSEGRPNKTFFPIPSNGPTGELKTQNNYDLYGRLVEVVETNPISASIWKMGRAAPDQTIEQDGDGTQATRQYDLTAGRLSNIALSTPSSIPALNTISYAYTDDGNVQSRTAPGITESYSYDELHRLKTWGHTHLGTSFRREYSYNDFGDLTGTKAYNALQAGTLTAQETYTFGVTSPRIIPSAVKSDGTNGYTYDVQGRRKTRTATGSSAETITYNHWSLPTSITGPNGTLTVQYDALGRRAYRKFNSDEILYIDDLFENRWNGSNSTYVMHIRAGGRTVATVSQPQTSTAPLSFVYPHDDALGSTTFTTNGTPVTTRFFYEPFGARVDVDGKTAVAIDATVHHDFTGQERDPLGYINMNGRLYDPALRRFISADPMVSHPNLSQGYNPFAYVRNNPATLHDPSGFAEEAQGTITLSGDYVQNPYGVGPYDYATTDVESDGYVGAGTSDDSPADPRYGTSEAGEVPSPGDTANDGAGKGGKSGAKPASDSDPSKESKICDIMSPVSGPAPAPLEQGRPPIPVAADPRQPEITVYVYGQRPQTAPGPSYDPFLLGITPPTRTRPEFFSITGAKLEFPDVPAAPYVETEAFVDQKGKVTTSSGVGGVIGVPHVANIHAGAAILSDGKLMLQAEVEVMGVGMGMFGEYGEAGLYITEGPQIFQGTGVGFQFEDASSAPELP